jgi:catechol 2,3-dioxygenase-like lactoylglutathione lyase family enzyme
MRLAEIFHTGITVSDLEQSIAFYRDVLGLELVTQWDSAQPYLRTVVGFPEAELRIALLRLPAAQRGVSGHHIELLEYRAPRGTRGDARTCNPGNVHVSFMVEDLDAAYEELSAKGVRFKSPPVEITHGRNRGAKAVYLLDPDDITLELVQPAPRAASAGAPAAGAPAVGGA